MVTEKELRDEHVLSLILRFSGPAIAGMLMMSIYNIVDRIFIGHYVGPLGIAGLAVAFPVMMIKGAIGSLVGWGGASLISIRLGEGNKDEAEKILGNAIILIFVLAALASLLTFIFLEPLMRLFGASDRVLPYTIDYMRIVLVGNLFHLMGVNSLIRAEGSPRTAMITSFIGAGLNIVLDAVFVICWQMGVTGAALATAISQFASSCWVMSYYLRGKSLLKLKWQNLRISLHRSLTICSVGMPFFLRTIVHSLVVILLNNKLRLHGGDLAVSAMGIINSVDSLVMLPLMGLSNGAQPVIGFNFGAVQTKRVKQTLFYAVALATGMAVAVFLLILFFPSVFLRLFTKDAQLITLGSRGLQLFLLMIPVLGFQIIGSNYFQATGRPGQAIILNLARQAIFLVPALLIMPHFLDLDGVWLSQPAADVLAVLLTAVFIWREIRSLNQKEKAGTSLA
ncbi:MAG: MATE family efflux transporter [Firmicutes bacterium]|nr:MATE family efflux transporter [Bacillota bacterium]